MSKTPAYAITTADDVVVATRTEGKAADKLARKLTDEAGQVHRVYTPTGRLRLETEVTELAVAAPTDGMAEEVDEDAFTSLLAECLAEQAEQDEPEVEAEPEVEDEPEVEAEQAEPEAEDEPEVTPYHVVMAQLEDKDEDVRQAAEAEWMRRQEIYGATTRQSDPGKKLVGPKMAAALETGTTTDGRTRAALARRGLIDVHADRTFTITQAGRGALAAAVAAVA